MSMQPTPVAPKSAIAEWGEALVNAAASRNYVSALVGATTMFVTLGVIDQQNAADIVAGAQQFMDGLGQMIGGAKKVLLIVGPIAVGVVAKIAGSSASLKARLTAVTQDPRVQIEGVIKVADPKVAAEVPSPQVVAAPVAPQ